MTNSSSSVPTSFRVIGVLALLWNLLGLAVYVMQVTMTPETLSAYTEAERSLYSDVPVWATSAFATAVTFGVLGCILLLLRRSWALPAFLVSLAAVLVQTYHSFVIANTIEVLGPMSAVGPAFVLGIGCALVWYTRHAKENGWLR